MLTRSAVAKRLKCSLATVRRLEGHELFPERDARGVHRFDEGDVNRVAQRLLAGGLNAARGHWLRSGRRAHGRGAHGPSRLCVDSQAKQSELHRLRRSNRRLARELDALKQQVALLLRELAGDG